MRFLAHKVEELKNKWKTGSGFLGFPKTTLNFNERVPKFSRKLNIWYNYS